MTQDDAPRTLAGHEFVDRYTPLPPGDAVETSRRAAYARREGMRGAIRTIEREAAGDAIGALKTSVDALRAFYGIDVLRELGLASIVTGERANEEMALWLGMDAALDERNR